MKLAGEKNFEEPKPGTPVELCNAVQQGLLELSKAWSDNHQIYLTESKEAFHLQAVKTASLN